MGSLNFDSLSQEVGRNTPVAIDYDRPEKKAETLSEAVRILSFSSAAALLPTPTPLTLQRLGDRSAPGIASCTMLSLFQSVFGPPSRTRKQFDDALIERATEHVVDGTDARLRAVIGYRKKLRPAVERAVEYVIELADGLPPPVEFSKRQYGTDPRLRAFFASPERLQEVVRSSPTIRSYASQGRRPVTNMIYAGLGTEREERKVLGMDFAGQTLRRDVEQVVVNFCNHRFVAVTDDETATRWELKKRAFDNLIETALRRIVAERTKRDELAQERHLLGKKLQALADGHWGLESVLDRGQSGPADMAAIETQIASIDAELTRIGATAVNLNDYLAVVADTLSAPQEHLRREAVSLTLSRMGIKLPQGSQAFGDTLQLSEFSTSDGRCAIVVLVSIPWGEFPDRSSDFFTEASRYLG